MLRYVLKLRTVYSRLETNDSDLKDKLHKCLRFKERGYFHSPLYRQRKWDGFVNFFTRETGQFLTGLLPEVVTALRAMKIPFQVEDLRQGGHFLRSTINEDFLWNRNHKRPIVLRDYQIELANQALKAKRGIIEAKTGAGKTHILNSLLKCTPPDYRTLVLVDRKELVTQNYEEICKCGFDDVGMFYGSVKKPGMITVALINSAMKMEEYFPEVRALYVDEVHDGCSARWIEVYKKLTAADIRIGFSATPFRYGGKDHVQKFRIKGHIGGILELDENSKPSTQNLQERKILSKAECTFYNIPHPQRLYDIYQDAVSFCIVQNDYLNNAVANLVKNKLTGRTLIVVERIEHGERLLRLMPDAYWLHGNQKEEVRKETVERLKHQKGDVVAIAVDKIVNKGVNVFIHNLINCAGGKADHQVLQRMGRGLRPSDDKQDLRYIDFYFQNNPYLEKHSEERVRVLEAEGHKIDIKNEFDF